MFYFTSQQPHIRASTGSNWPFSVGRHQQLTARMLPVTKLKSPPNERHKEQFFAITRQFRPDAIASKPRSYRRTACLRRGFRMRCRQGIHQNVHCIFAHIVLARGELLDLLTTTAEKREDVFSKKDRKIHQFPF